jgi:hypothetical protein
MAHGGARPGAGRKKGTANRKSREIANRAFADGVTPLEVMLAVMRKHYAAEDLDKAVAVAKDAAPYMHPRLNPIAPVGEEGRAAGYVVVPPAAESVEAWSRAAAQVLKIPAKSGDPSPVPKPSC